MYTLDCNGYKISPSRSVSAALWAISWQESSEGTGKSQFGTAIHGASQPTHIISNLTISFIFASKSVFIGFFIFVIFVWHEEYCSILLFLILI